MSKKKNFKHRNAYLTEFQKQVCLGTLLGDSSANCPKNGRNYHLSCYHAESQLDWLKQKWEWLQPHTRPIQLTAYLDKRDGKTRKGGRFHTISAPCFTEFGELFYKNGRKTITEELINRFNHPVALACLICDDGTWDKAGIQIASKQFNEAENETLARGIMLVYKIEVYTICGDYWSIRIPAASVEKVFDLCRPYIPDSMLYKFGGGNYQATIYIGKKEFKCPVCNKKFFDYESTGRKYCSRECAGKGRKNGYDTRSQYIACMRCQTTFLQYSKRVKFCSKCRGKRIIPIPCIICGKPVETRKRLTCSKSCSVALGHRNR